MNQIEELKFCNFLCKLPPDSWLLLANTSERKKNWENWRYFYSLLSDSLSCYFGGKSWDYPENLEQSYVDFLKLKQDYFLTLYTLIWRLWKDFKSKDPLLPETPIDCLIAFLEAESIQALLMMYPEITDQSNYRSFSPREYHLRGREIRKLIYLNNRTPEQENRFKELVHPRLEADKTGVFLFLNELLLLAHQKSKKDKSIKSAVKSFESTLDNLHDFRLKETHPSKKLAGWAVIDGFWRPLRQS